MNNPSNYKFKWLKIKNFKIILTINFITGGFKVAILIMSRCKQCSHEGNPQNGFSIGKYSNKPYHELRCISGRHTTKYFDAVPVYGLFFQNGLYAFHKEEYFEAFTSLYHSYELFKMNFVQTVLINSNNFSYKETIDYLKPIRKNSVQIDGAFNVLYAIRNKKIAPDIPSKLKNIRNTIIHGSHYPEAKDVEKCIKDIYKFIYPIESQLITRNSYPYSEFQVLGDARLEYLQIEKILNRSEFDSGLSDVMTNNANILGRFPVPGDNSYTEPFTFDEILSSSKVQLEIIENTIAIFKNHKK